MKIISVDFSPKVLNVGDILTVTAVLQNDTASPATTRDHTTMP